MPTYPGGPGRKTYIRTVPGTNDRYEYIHTSEQGKPWISSSVDQGTDGKGWESEETAIYWANIYHGEWPVIPIPMIEANWTWWDPDWPAD